MSQQKYVGVWPVMLTLLILEIDWAIIRAPCRLVYRCGRTWLFAARQSSEMFYLSDEETRKALTRFIVEKRMEEYLLLLLVIRQRP